MTKEVRCPVCSGTDLTGPIKKWRYRAFDVRRYSCRTCKTNFNIFTSPRLTYTIPKPRPKKT